MSEYAYTPNHAEREEALFLGDPASDKMLDDLEALASVLLTDELKTVVDIQTYQNDITGAYLCVRAINHDDVDSSIPWVSLSIGLEGDDHPITLNFTHTNKLNGTKGMNRANLSETVKIAEDLLDDNVPDNTARSMLKILRTLAKNKSFDNTKLTDSKGIHLADLARSCVTNGRMRTELVRLDYFRNIGEHLTLQLVQYEVKAHAGTDLADLPDKLCIVLDDKANGVTHTYKLSQDDESTLLVTTPKDSSADRFLYTPRRKDSEEAIKMYLEFYATLEDTIPREAHVQLIMRDLVLAARIDSGC